MAHLNPNGTEALQKYLEGIISLNESVQARPLAKCDVSETLIGASSLSCVAIVEFPDEASIHKLFSSHEYPKQIRFRDKAFIGVEAFVSK